MLAGLLDDLKAKVDGALKLAVAGSVAAAAALAAFACFAAALFIWTERSYGRLEAWLALGCLFLLVCAVGAAVILYVRNRQRERAVRPQPVRSSLLQDPAVLLTGLQVVRVIGARNLVPLLIVGAIAGGFLAGRNGHPRDPDQPGRHAAERG